MHKLIFGVLGTIVLVGCTAQKDDVASVAVPVSVDEVKRIVGQTSEPICSLNLQAGLPDHETDAGKAIWGEFADYNAYARRTQAAAGPDFVQYSRRAALHRLLHVPEGADTRADGFYEALDDGIPNPTSFAEHIEKIDYWDDRIREQHADEDKESGAHNMRFCVINEKGGAARAVAQQFMLDGLENKTLSFKDDINGFLQDREFLAPPFKKKIIFHASQLPKAERAGLAPIGLLRDRTSVVLPSDPKTAEAFWEARDVEIDAVIDYIKTHSFKSNADQLKAMTSIDQSLRHMFSAANKMKVHFGNEDEAKKVRDGIPTRMFRVDAFNTAQLEEMLENRGWITDDKDGQGAANSAWLIAQHADQNPDFQRRVLKLMKPALDAPGVSKSNYAYLYDRVAGKDKVPQRYGTQGQCTGPGTWEPTELEDAENVDALRAEVGLGTLAEYKTWFEDSCIEDQR